MTNGIQTIRKYLGLLWVFIPCIIVVGCTEPKPEVAHPAGKRKDCFVYIDKQGKQFAGPFDYGYPFTQGLASVKINKRYGFIDKTGTMRIKQQYLEAEPFEEGIACVRFEDRTFGYIDPSGKQIFEKRFPDARPFRDGLAAVRLTPERGTPWGFISRDGTMVIQPKWIQAGRFSDGRCIVKKTTSADPDYGYMDKTGAIVIPFIYRKEERFNNGYAVVRTTSGELQKIDRNGKRVPLATGCNLYPMQREGDWGFVDARNRFVVAPKYLEARPFKEGLAAVLAANRKWGFIDESGALAVPAQYDSVGDFSEGYANFALTSSAGAADTVATENKAGYIDQTGRVAIPANFKSSTPFSEGCAVVEPLNCAETE